MSGNFGGRNVGVKGRTKYTPDYNAIVMGVYGKQPKGALNPIQPRPIPRGFEWAGKLKIGNLFARSPRRKRRR